MKKYLLALFIILSFGLVRADTWYDTIKASTDDIHFIYDAVPETTLYTTGTSGNINPAGSNGGVAVRFTTCPIPIGATITSCSLSFVSNADVTGTCSTMVSIEDTADAATFSTKGDLAIRLWATATDSVLVSNAVANARYWAVLDPSVLQEVIDRGDWAANNDIAFVTKKLAIGTAAHKVLMYDYTTTLCAEIRVYYTIAAASTRPVRYVHGPGGAAKTQSINGKSAINEP